MAIEQPLINLYKTLEDKIHDRKDRKRYCFWGRNLLYKNVTYCIRYGKGGKILGVSDLGTYLVPNGERKPKTEKIKEVIPMWFKTRTRAKIPFLFCDSIANLIDPLYVAIYEQGRKEVFGDMELADCIEDWFKCIPNIKAAIEEFKANNKTSKGFEKENIKFVYGEDGDDTPLTIRPEVLELMSANDYEMRHKWFSITPKIATKIEAEMSGKEVKKGKAKSDEEEDEGSEDEIAADDGEVYYDVVDDKPLKLSEVYLGHIGQVFGGGFNLTPVSFNVRENNNGHPDCRNYPMSRIHGEMMDAALSWLYRPVKTIPYCGPLADEEQMKIYHDNIREQNYTQFSHKGHNYLWFPVITEDTVIEDMDDLIDKFKSMNSALRDLIEGKINLHVTFNDRGQIEDTPFNREFIPWIADDEIMLYEVTLNGKRMMLTERPFSIEKLAKNIHAYNTKMVTCQAGAKWASVKYGQLSPDKTIAQHISLMVAHMCDESYISWKSATTATRLWNDYLKNHIFEGRAVSKELLHKVRQKAVYSMRDYHGIFGKKGANGYDRTAMLTELTASLGMTPEELSNEKAYKAGRIMAYLAGRQQELKLPVSFGENRMHAVYSGAVDLKKEIEDFITLSPEIKEARRKEYGRYINQANKLKEKGKALGVNLGWENVLNAMNVDASKFYRANAKSAFGVALAAITTTLGKEARNVIDADSSNKTEFGKFMGYLFNRVKELGDGCRISSDADKTKFILGFYA